MFSPSSSLMSASASKLALAIFTLASSAVAGPCDIYASGHTPCVAAHSTTRALYDGFSGALYQIKRSSDGATRTIAPMTAGGVANAAAQDAFCASTTCLITVIYDQSGRGNHLTQAPGGQAARGPQPGGYDNLASAEGAPVTVNGHKAYGVFISPHTGYRNNNANGTAVKDQPEGIYAVVDGTHYNDGCCFDYGNAETDNTDPGNGYMETVYFGSRRGTGNGNGPWVLADLENGLYGGAVLGNNPKNPSLSYRFVTAVVKGEPNHWSIRAGNAKSGGLSTFWNGTRPSAQGYSPMNKEGAIVLGVGGDNSNGAQGTFYEGVMTSGYPSDAIEDAVQANIVAANYAAAPLTSGPALNVGSSISLRATSACCTTKYLAHDGNTVRLQVVTGSSPATLKQQASWIVRTGLGNSGCFSFESKDTPGSFLRHYTLQLRVDANDGSKLFQEDATFCPQAGLTGQGSSFRAWAIPTRYWRHFQGMGYIAAEGDVNSFDAAASFNSDVTWVVGASFA